MMMKNKRLNKIALLLVLALSLSLTGQAQSATGKQGMRSRLEKLGRETKDYIHGSRGLTTDHSARPTERSS